MEKIFDLIVTSRIIFSLFIIALIILVTAMIFTFRLFRKGWKGYISMATFYLAVVALVLYLMKGDYGLVTSISSMKAVNGKICILDNKPYFITRRYVAGLPLFQNRILLIDPQNGKRICRVFAGYDVKWLKNSTSLLLFDSRGKFGVFDADTKKIARVIDPDYLIDKFSQFSCGVEEIEYIKDFVIVHLKDGHTAYYDPFTDVVVGKPDENHYKYEQWSCYGKKISFIKDGRENEIYCLKPAKAGEKIELLKTMANEKGKQLVSSCSFIDGSCNSIFPEDNIILVTSYENTDCERCMITALDLDLKTLWTIDYKTLAPKDFFSSKQLSISEMALFNGKLFFGISGMVYCVDKMTGKIEWKRRP